MLIAKLHSCLFDYGHLIGNESLIKDLWYIANRILHKFLLQKRRNCKTLPFPGGTLLFLLGTPQFEIIFNKNTYLRGTNFRGY